MFEDPARATSILMKPKENAEGLSAIVVKLRHAGALVGDESCSQFLPSLLVKPGDEMGDVLLALPVSISRPVVLHQKDLRYWSITAPEALPYRALVTGAGAVSRDYEGLSCYPDYWVQTWKARDGLSLLPSSIAQYIRMAENLALNRNGRSVPIPELSAVWPNVHKPALPVHRPLFWEHNSVPAAPSWWHTLPLTARHSGLVFMPRICNGAPRAYLNSLSAPALIDANFSTFSLGTGQLPVEALFAFLNSIWARAALESMCTPLGGGALKVEATHLRMLPVPKLDRDTIAQLRGLGQELAQALHSTAMPNALKAIDKVVCSQMAGLFGIEGARLLSILNSLVDDLQERRRR
ncbi:MAG: hypothetical protein HYX94_07440 [Chloroflexi bacterium]|nr:hypothetical protein [Chloroflexota bacterium]